MRRITLMAVLAATVLSSCMNTVLPVTRGRIETRDQFISTLGDRTVSNGEVTVQMEEPVMRRRDRMPTITVRGDIDDSLQPPDVSAAITRQLEPIRKATSG